LHLICTLGKKEKKEEGKGEINTVSYCYATDLSTRSAKRLWLSMGLLQVYLPTLHDSHTGVGRVKH